MDYFTHTNIVLLAVLILSFVLTYLTLKLAIRKAILDIPNHRSSHSAPTPRGGGLAIAIVWYLGLVGFYLIGDLQLNLFIALMSGLFISVISIIDDIKNVSPKIRLLFQALSAGVAIFFIGDIKGFDFGIFSISNYYILLPICFVGILWFVNLFNFLDGIDGYISTAGIFISMALFYFVGTPVLLLVAASILGFLPWNWQRAKIFMGDVGSTLIGFNIAVLALWYVNNFELIDISLILVITSVYWFDATITLLRRFVNKEKLSEAHRKHAYQRIVQSGYSHQKTVLIVLGINIIMLLLSLLMFYNVIDGFLGFLICIIINMIFYYIVEHKYRFN